MQKLNKLSSILYVGEAAKEKMHLYASMLVTCTENLGWF